MTQRKNSKIFLIFGFLSIINPALVFAETPAPSSGQEVQTVIQQDDPLEPFNRAMFHFNELIDGLFLKPFSILYGMVVEEHIQEGIHNALNNLSSPVVLFNDVLQGERERAFETFGRFFINSTLGVGGIFDPAEEMIAPYHHEDFGQTLAVHGIESGPYLMLPLIGPSNPRDFFGKIIDTVIDPVTFMSRRIGKRQFIYGRYALDLIDRRKNSKAIEDTIYSSPDPYAMTKTLYIQHREFNIENGNVDRESPSPLDNDNE